MNEEEHEIRIEDLVVLSTLEYIQETVDNWDVTKSKITISSLSEETGLSMKTIHNKLQENPELKELTQIKNVSYFRHKARERDRERRMRIQNKQNNRKKLSIGRDHSELSLTRH